MIFTRSWPSLRMKSFILALQVRGEDEGRQNGGHAESATPPARFANGELENSITEHCMPSTAKGAYIYDLGTNCMQDDIEHLGLYHNFFVAKTLMGDILYDSYNVQFHKHSNTTLTPLIQTQPLPSRSYHKAFSNSRNSFDLSRHAVRTQNDTSDLQNHLQLFLSVRSTLEPTWKYRPLRSLHTAPAPGTRTRHDRLDHVSTSFEARSTSKEQSCGTEGAVGHES
jgi:hypothetical protein